MNTTYMDCYASFNDGVLNVGNKSIERSILFRNNFPITRYIVNKKTGYKWFHPQGKDLASFHLPVLNFECCEIRITSCVSNNHGLSQDFLLVCVEFAERNVIIKWHLEVSPGLPFITTKLYVKGDPQNNTSKNPCNSIRKESTGIEIQEGTDMVEKQIQLPEKDAVDAFEIYDKHLKLETLRFFDVTDVNDTLVRKSEELVYANRGQTAAGNVFIIKSYLEDEGLFMVKEGLTAGVSLNRSQDELILKPCSCVQLTGTGLDYTNLSRDEFTPCYGSTVGVGYVQDLKKLYKKYYNRVYQGDAGRNLFIMSNTWGDRNQDKAVCEEFILREIEIGRQIGVDILQIDDGWQKGITSNSAMAKGGVWEGYYAFDPEFWTVNAKKFPRGLEPVAEAGKRNSIKIGLWFSPDASGDMKNWEKDAEILLNLYKTYDVRYFKLDGVKIRNKKCEINLIKLMERVTKESKNEVSFNLDITAEVRFGYFYEKQFGTLFVENRYTDWGSYCPHKTLKNLWQLSEILPARKFQFELLNNKRNESRYENDLLAPGHYTMDYLFAITMFSNSLVWMEMSNLWEEDIKVLKNIIQVYKKERQRIFSAEIFPIGDMPDGISFTGFQAVVNEKEGYLLLFRELTKVDTYVFKVNDLAGKKIKIENLYASGDGSCIIMTDCVTADGDLEVQMEKPRTFLFARYSVI